MVDASGVNPIYAINSIPNAYFFYEPHLLSNQWDPLQVITTLAHFPVVIASFRRTIRLR